MRLTGSVPSICNRQTVTVRVQMGVIESSRILQPGSNHSIKANVRDPYERERHNRRAIRPEGVGSQHQGANVGVDSVVSDRSHPDIDNEAEHREIRQETQQGKLKPTAVAPMVKQEADGQYCGTF